MKKTASLLLVKTLCLAIIITASVVQINVSNYTTNIIIDGIPNYEDAINAPPLLRQSPILSSSSSSDSSNSTKSSPSYSSSSSNTDDDGDDDDDDDWFDEHRWWNKIRPYNEWTSDNGRQGGIFPFQSCHYVEDACRISNKKGWIYNPFLDYHDVQQQQQQQQQQHQVPIEFNSTVTDTTTGRYYINNRTYVINKKTIEYYNLFSQQRRPIVKFTGVEEDDDYEWAGGDLSFYERIGEWNIGYLNRSYKRNMMLQSKYPSSCSYSPVTIILFYMVHIHIC
jgi:hypothetical protein